ncbi:MAG: glycosyltransferase family 2 protein [Syntrophus sp. (in: bacteria)]|nr:glycosyltransferase family 2 protein [Syntrophus sp. (in: bacteria)]
MISPLISVILPVYNGAETLACALSSVLEQTFENYEILLLDDGSTDNSLQVASMFSDPRLRVFNDGTNHGLAYRLNQGIDLARGPYIARMDQDDVCFPERFAKQIKFLEVHPEIDLLGCRAMVFRNQHDILGLIPFRGTHEEICADPWRGLYLAHPSWMGRTEWFRRHRYRIPEAIHADDQELLLRTYPESRFACLEEVLLAYRKEHFRLSKIWRARLALLKVQLSHFARRRQWSNALLSVVSAFLKVVVDFAVIVMGDKRLFFGQIAEPVPTSLLERFHKLGCESRFRDETRG